MFLRVETYFISAHRVLQRSTERTVENIVIKCLREADLVLQPLGDIHKRSSREKGNRLY